MQLASIMLSLAGDNGNQVPKYNVTPSEVAVLRVLHGNDAVENIKVTGEAARSSRQERQRLVDIYSQVQPDGTKRAKAVDMLFPGVAARLFETFDELEDVETDEDIGDMDDDIVPVEPVKSAKAAKPRAAAKSGASKKAKTAAAPEPEEQSAAADTEADEAAEGDDEDTDDEIGEINDGVGGNADDMFK